MEADVGSPIRLGKAAGHAPRYQEGGSARASRSEKL